jgi:trimeric autotransporter adhesin
VKYIGPVAQDFWTAFRLGGTDSLGINSISIDGVNMAAIQALERRTTELQIAETELASVRIDLQKKTRQIDDLTDRVKQLETLITSAMEFRGSEAAAKK